MSRWANINGFCFSTSKSVAIHFCRNRGVHPDPNLNLANRRLLYGEATRYLVLVFHNRLTWDPHFPSFKASCRKLEYVCKINSSATDARLHGLDSVYYVAVRLATGAFRTSPIPSLLVDADFWPVDLRR
ncbi:hypothetical protein E2C01_078152 [Portunus trituberculatus]|uniref:Uncharacterized protein n=1 Tax=Portunus trituberculatus TaxID=210409 RepID=A0A5B7IHZ6_PORTR|nr:hypothetical protein [Portunus trituberculatus]